MKANTVTVELRPGWPMHVGVVTNDRGDITWKAPVARTNSYDALADAGEYLEAAANDTRPIDDQLDQLDALIKARRDRVAASMAAEQCSCTLCQHTRAVTGVSLCDTVFA